MKIDIDKKLLRESEIDLQQLLTQLLTQISTGKAILFTGAGFSIGTKNVSGEEPPLAKNLAKEICRLGGFDEDNDLRYAADYFLSISSKAKLITLLKEKYSLTDVSDTHVNICKVNWMRSYTTNYDKSIEIASGMAGNVVECIDLNFRTDEYYKRNGLCVHLNGSIDSLNEESLENSFKLSTSSYISADSFVTSNWHYYFKRDLERSSAIVFVGYSMYDIDIQKILFENQESFKEKTYFITVPDPDQKSKFTQSKFGHVLTIGVDGFAKFIQEKSELFEMEEWEHHMRALSLYEVSNDSQQIRDANIETMLMYGDIDKNFIDKAVIGDQRVAYLVLRDQLERILEFTQKIQNTIIFSELGNGKSIFLRELKPYLSVRSIEIYEITDRDGDYIGDIDTLAKSDRLIAIILDGYEYYLDLLKHYCYSLPKNISIIAATRTSEHDRFKPKLKEMDFSFNEINIDSLTDEESSRFVDIIDNVGMWGEKAGLTHNRKISFLTVENNRQISSLLLTLFNAPQIKQKVSSLLDKLCDNQNYKDTIFSISLLNYLDLPMDFSLVSDVARNDYIYKSELRQNESFKQLFKLSNNQVVSKSSLFCLLLIRNHFLASYITNQLQKVAQKFSGYPHKDVKQEKLFKSTLKFSFVERLLPDTNKKSNLMSYYEGLKSSVSWLKYDPHYWLQYGMANITFKEYDRAQKFLDQAYSLAKAKPNDYDTKKIDTQQARLFILLAINQASNQASNNVNSHDIYEKFDKANKLLARLDNDVYKFRQVEKYRDYFESCYSKLSKKNQTNFEHACKNMLANIAKAENRGEIDSREQTPIAKAKENLSFVLNAIAVDSKHK